MMCLSCSVSIADDQLGNSMLSLSIKKKITKMNKNGSIDFDEYIKFVLNGVFTNEECKYMLGKLKFDSDYILANRKGKYMKSGISNKETAAYYMYLILNKEVSWAFQHYYKTFYDVKTIEPLECKLGIINDACIPEIIYQNKEDYSEAKSIQSEIIEYWSTRDLEMYKKWATLTRKSKYVDGDTVIPTNVGIPEN